MTEYMPSMHEILGSPPHSKELISKEYKMKIHQDHEEKRQKEPYSFNLKYGNKVRAEEGWCEMLYLGHGMVHLLTDNQIEIVLIILISIPAGSTD